MGTRPPATGPGSRADDLSWWKTLDPLPDLTRLLLLATLVSLLLLRPPLHAYVSGAVDHAQLWLRPELGRSIESPFCRCLEQRLERQHQPRKWKLYSTYDKNPDFFRLLVLWRSPLRRVEKNGKSVKFSKFAPIHMSTLAYLDVPLYHCSYPDSAVQ